MASVDYMKVKTRAHLYNLLAHCSKAERLADEHRNKQINKARTAENDELWGRDEAAERFRARIKELDESTNTNKRKDRVEAFGLEIPTPPGIAAMSQAKQREWLGDVYELVEGRVGSENVIGAFTHEDELHEYRDARTGLTALSRRHLQIYVVPEQGGILNGRKFSAPGAMRRMNKAIEDMTQAKYGVPFLTGKDPATPEVPYGTAVEDLKMESGLVQDVMDEHTGLIAQEKEQADEYARATRRKADKDAAGKLRDAEREARAIREAAEKAAQDTREQAERDAQAVREAMRTALKAAKAERDEARKDAKDAREWAGKLWDAHRVAQKALQGDLSALEEQEARKGARTLLEASGAVVRRVTAECVRVPPSVTPGPVAGSVYAELKRRIADMDGKPGPTSVEGPTL